MVLFFQGGKDLAQSNNPKPTGYYPQAPMRQMPYAQQQQPYGAYPPYGVGVPSLQVPTGVAGAKGGSEVPGMLPIEESYIENILRLNKGKLVEVYSTFEHNTEWNAKIFQGIIEAAGRDHVILSSPETGQRFLIPMVYVDFVVFEEPIEYEPHFGIGLAHYPPR